MRFALSIALFAAACSPANNANPCPNGICVGGSDGGMPGGNDGGGGPCVESWICTQWVSIGNSMYTRNCGDNNRCGTTLSKPSEGPIGLPNLDMDYYKCKVEPIVDRGCAMMGCHGTASSDNSRAYRVYARGRRRNSQQVPAMCLDSGMQNLDKGSGTIMCYGWSAHTNEEWQANFDSARALMVGLTNPDDSDLLAQPVAGGKSHSGVHLFAGKSDADYQTIKAWLGGAKLGSTCNPMN
jgi:hypothetical protein